MPSSCERSGCCRLTSLPWSRTPFGDGFACDLVGWASPTGRSTSLVGSARPIKTEDPNVGAFGHGANRGYLVANLVSESGEGTAMRDEIRRLTCPAALADLVQEVLARQ